MVMAKDASLPHTSTVVAMDHPMTCVCTHRLLVTTASLTLLLVSISYRMDVTAASASAVVAASTALALPSAGPYSRHQHHREGLPDSADPTQRWPTIDPPDVTRIQWEGMKANAAYDSCTYLARCRFPCNWDRNNSVNPCFNGCRCPTPDCMVVEVRSTYECVANPFYARSANHSGRQGLTCVREMTSTFDESSSSVLEDADVAKFKRRTQHFFEPWYNWKSGECAPLPPQADRTMRVEYDAHEHAFTLHNTCIRSDGRLAAYYPVGIPSYSDRSSVIYGAGDRDKFFAQIESLRSAPECLHRRPVYLDYVITPHYNTFFAATKAAALAKLFKHKWPTSDDVLTLHVISPAAQENRHRPNAHNYFRGALSKGGWAAMWHRPKDRPLPSSHEDVGMVCFEKIVTLHPCETDMCDGGATQGELTDLKWKVVAEGARYASEKASVQRLRDEMAKCTGIARATTNKDHPRLIIVDRHHKKRYANLNMVMPKIADYAFAAGFSTLHVVDQQDGIDPLGLVRLHQRADVILGHFGGGMTWLFVQPPGSVAVETAVGSCADNHFTQWDQAVDCDYGGLSQNADVSHYVSYVPKSSLLMHEDLQLTAEYWYKVMDLALCKLRANPIGGRSLNANDCETVNQLQWKTMVPDTNAPELMLADP